MSPSPGPRPRRHRLQTRLPLRTLFPLRIKRARWRGWRSGALGQAVHSGRCCPAVLRALVPACPGPSPRHVKPRGVKAEALVRAARGGRSMRVACYSVTDAKISFVLALQSFRGGRRVCPTPLPAAHTCGVIPGVLAGSPAPQRDERLIVKGHLCPLHPGGWRRWEGVQGGGGMLGEVQSWEGVQSWGMRGGRGCWEGVQGGGGRWEARAGGGACRERQPRGFRMQRTRDTRGRGAPRRAGLPREVFTVLPKSGRETGESEPRGSAGQGGARARKRARLGGRAGRVLSCGPEHPALLEAGLASRRAPAPTRAPATSATACDMLSPSQRAGP